MGARAVRCPKCGAEAERAVEDTEIVDLASGPRRAQFDGAATRRVEPCGCRFAPGEFAALLEIAGDTR